MKLLTLLVGPPEVDMSDLACSLIFNDGDHGAATTYINQYTQGKESLDILYTGINSGDHILIDRLSFDKSQLDKYLLPAKKAGYITKIIILYENYDYQKIKDLEADEIVLSRN